MQCLSAYEQERLRNISENTAKLRELGLVGVAAASLPRVPRQKRERVSHGATGLCPPRRADRLQREGHGVCYLESLSDDYDSDTNAKRNRRCRPQKQNVCRRLLAQERAIRRELHLEEKAKRRELHLEEREKRHREQHLAREGTRRSRQPGPSSSRVCSSSIRVRHGMNSFHRRWYGPLQELPVPAQPRPSEPRCAPTESAGRTACSFCHVVFRVNLDGSMRVHQCVTHTATYARCSACGVVFRTNNDGSARRHLCSGDASAAPATA